MTNIIKIGDHSKAVAAPKRNTAPRFYYRFVVEVYFKDRRREIVQIDKSTTRKLSYVNGHNAYISECYKLVYSQYDKEDIVLTWSKTYLKNHDSGREHQFSTVPQLHFPGGQVDLCDLESNFSQSTAFMATAETSIASLQTSDE